MDLKDLEGAVERLGSLEEDVLRLIEEHPHLIRSPAMVYVLAQLKIAASAMDSARNSLTSLSLWDAAKPRETAERRM
jgi:hypothetical protein